MEIRNNPTKISFSIIMANYNRAKYLDEAINSVIAQTYSKWELIIIDDCSTDNSLEKIKPFLKDKRIKLIKNKQNLGAGATKKKGVENASHEIIGILDSDDKLLNTALEVMADAYQRYSDYGFIYSTCWICDSELKNCKIVERIGPIIPEKTCIFYSNISQFRTYRRSVYKRTAGFNPNLKAAVDKDLYLKLEEVTDFKFIKIPLYFIRQHDKGISQGKNKFNARIYHYIAKYNAYRRRLNTNFPNLTKRDLYVEYFKITFNQIIRFIKFFWNLIGLSKILEFFLDLKTIPPMRIKIRIENLNNKLKKK